MTRNWDIRREGRPWTDAEALERYALAPDRLEMVKGKLLWHDEARHTLLALLLENAGVDAAVRLGSPGVWLEAVSQFTTPTALTRNGDYAVDDTTPAGVEDLSDEGRVCARLLRQSMSDLSQDYWAAGWLTDLEFELWSAVLGEPSPFTAMEVAQLRYLSSKCGGGWITWLGEKPWSRYMPAAQWAEDYDEWQRASNRE